jgi:hypothetical protein
MHFVRSAMDSLSWLLKLPCLEHACMCVGEGLCHARSVYTCNARSTVWGYKTYLTQHIQARPFTICQTDRSIWSVLTAHCSRVSNTMAGYLAKLHQWYVVLSVDRPRKHLVSRAAVLLINLHWKPILPWSADISVDYADLITTTSALVQSSYEL